MSERPDLTLKKVSNLVDVVIGTSYNAMFVLLGVLVVGFKGARLNVSLEPDALAAGGSDALSARAALFEEARHGAARKSSNYSSAYSPDLMLLDRFSIK